ncbi:uncharacterized protein LOC143296571 [Babylonia areolata]|uniref:uncharacterized protein LOC143296571 n=1 Tax=Babylonia areolata TaxID=304850 RepID=UPI003FCF3F1E
MGGGGGGGGVKKKVWVGNKLGGTLLHVICEEETAAEKATPRGVQWVIPSLAVVAVCLVLVLALVLYKYYHSRQGKSRNVYRVSGAGYRFKPSQSGGSWTRGPLMESDTTESYLSQSVSTTTAPGFRDARSPVCRLLEHTQYVATPTEDEHRSPTAGPPAFASPAYFLPALSWLRLPALRQAWPGEGSGSTSGASTVYSAARPMQCDCGETTHRWLENEAQLLESATDNDPEYSEICDVPSTQQYASFPQIPWVQDNALGPYEYEMQETANGQDLCDCGPSFHQNYHQNHHPHRPLGGPFPGSEHRYETLWRCSEGDGSSLRIIPTETCSTTMGSCENGWLSRYRLPSPCVPILDPRDPGGGLPSHCHRTHRPHDSGGGRETTEPGHAHRSDGQLTVGGLNPASTTSFLYRPVPPCTWETGDRVGVADGRSEVKYVNPVYEGRGSEGPCVPGVASSPVLSRLWGYMGLNSRS